MKVEEEIEGLMEVLTKVDLDLAYSSEKLVNLNGLLMQLEAGDFGGGEEEASPEFMEKALVFGLLSGVLDSEVRELDSFMVSLEAGLVDAKRNISSCRDFSVLSPKLIGSEESLKLTRKQISELRTQSSRLQRTAQALAHGKSERDEEAFSKDDLLSNLNGELSGERIAGPRQILQMLEKSLARELEAEKKLSETRKREEDLRAELRYAEQSVSHSEDDSRVVLGMFLEADLSSAVFEGISRELRSKFERCREELKLKDLALETMKIGGSLGNGSNDFELAELKEKAKTLEEKLKDSEFRLSTANSFNESSQIRITELENLVDSLRESVEIADTRAESAELKVAELIGTNVELTEEMGFLKESVGSAEKKFGVLEKQVRESDIQLQHAKASSEASQEQQNMLYSAIWDMETLIEDLKSKVAKAESKNESTEENCIALSETNAELTNEIAVLRERVEELEACLEESKSSKIESANEVVAKTKAVMNLVVRLAAERERIQKQINALTKENENFAKILGFKAQNGVKEKEKDEHIKLHSSVTNNLSNSSCAQSSLETVKDSAGKSCQAVQ